MCRLKVLFSFLLVFFSVSFELPKNQEIFGCRKDPPLMLSALSSCFLLRPSSLFIAGAIWAVQEGEIAIRLLTCFCGFRALAARGLFLNSWPFHRV